MEKLTDKIDRYLDGAMNAEEKSAFENEINANPELKKQVDVQSNLRAGIERLGMKTTVSATFRKMTLKNKIYKWGVATVAVAAIGTATYFGYNAIAQDNYELPALNEQGTTLWADADRNLPTQLFEIDPGKDTVIETESGLIFAIPAGAFMHAQNPVTLEIREALTPMDIMKGGLSTTSDGQLLETGGMFYLNARNGETSLQLDPQKPIYANVPTNEIKPGMMLFTGERQTDGSINWKNPKPLEKQLVPVDIHSLDFYPKGFLHVLEGLGYDVTDKKLTDSIYYSYSGRKEKTAPYYYGNDPVIRTTYTLEINPASIAAIWNDQFQNTIISTKEFEERLQFIYTKCCAGYLELYINNLDKQLWQIDSMAMTGQAYCSELMYDQDFENFYLRHDGGITIDQPHMKELQEYQENKRKAVQLAAEKIFSRRNDIEFKQDSSFSAMKSQQNLDDATRAGENFAREFDVNLREAYRQLGKPYVKNPPANAYYGFNMNNTGWNNIDKYVFDGIDEAVLKSTINRTTLNYTDPGSGKKAVIKYEELKIIIADQNSYEQLTVYLASDSLPSFQKVYLKNGGYSEKLDELMQYSLVVFAQKGDQWYWYKTERVKPGTVDVKLETIAEEKLRNKLNRSFRGDMGQDFEKELEVMIGERTYRQQVKKREEQAEIDRQIMKVIFPCWEEPTVPSPAAPLQYAQ